MDLGHELDVPSSIDRVSDLSWNLCFCAVHGEITAMTEDERYYLMCPLRKNVVTRIPVTLCHRNKCFFLISKDGKLVCDYTGIQKKPRGVPRGVGEAATPQGQTPQGKQTTPQGKGTEWK